VTIGALAVAVAFVGLGLRYAMPREAPRDGNDMVLALAAGAAIAAVLLLVIAPLGPLPPALLRAGYLALVAAGAVACARRFGLLRGAAGEAVAAVRDSSWAERAAGLLIVGALILFAWKTAVVPLWSWDHLAMWGVKARKLAAGGLDLGFLADGRGHPARPDHPLGLPALWTLFAFVRVPDATLFKLTHVLFGAALALCFHGAARGLGASRLAANILTAFLCLSPLYADSEGLGLAEMPLALWSCAAIAGTVRGDSFRKDGPAVGIVLGFLPWLKQEGWPLALVLLAAVALWAARRGDLGAGPRPFAWVAVPALGMSAAALAYQRFVLPEDPGFIAGGGRERAVQRLGELPEFLRLAAGELSVADWLGFWFLLPVLTGAAIALRRRAAATLAAVVWIQTFLYLAICYISRSPAGDQLRAAFFRTCSVLVPLGLLAVAALSRDEPSGARRA
jgi:hypothetical protein